MFTITNPDGGDETNCNGKCSIAGSVGSKAGLAGLLLYPLIPAATILDRKFRIKNDI